MGKWRRCKWGDIATLEYGKALRDYNNNDGSYPVYGTNGPIGTANTYLSTGPGVIIGRKGAYRGVHFSSSPFYVIDTAFYLKPKTSEVDLHFAYYQLLTVDINSMDSGSAIPSTSRDDFYDIDVILPPIEEQRAISEVLSSLDDKTNLLHQQNHTLEQMGDALFKTLFMEEGIRACENKLKDYVYSANTGLDAIKRAPIVEQETGMKCLRIQDISQRKPFNIWGNTMVERGNFSRFQLRKNDIIMARTCSPGINYFVREDLQAVFNNGLVRLRANEDKVHPIFLYYLFRTRDFIGHIDGISGGTSVQLNMQVGDLLDYDITFLNKEKQNEVVSHFIDIDNKVNHNSKQIQNLEQLRDTLLPKLICGEVRVSSSKEKLVPA